MRQPLDASRDHLTKDQLQKKNSHAKIISSNTWRALFLFKFSKVQRFSVGFSRQRRFLQSLGVNLASARISTMLTAPSPHPEHRTVVWTGTSVGGDVSHRRWQLLWWQSHPWRLAGTSTTFRCRPAPPKPPEASAWLSA